VSAWGWVLVATLAGGAVTAAIAAWRYNESHSDAAWYIAWTAGAVALVAAIIGAVVLHWSLRGGTGARIGLIVSAVVAVASAGLSFVAATPTRPALRTIATAAVSAAIVLLLDRWDVAIGIAAGTFAGFLVFFGLVGLLGSAWFWRIRRREELGLARVQADAPRGVGTPATLSGRRSRTVEELYEELRRENPPELAVLQAAQNVRDRSHEPGEAGREETRLALEVLRRVLMDFPDPEDDEDADLADLDLDDDEPESDAPPRPVPPRPAPRRPVPVLPAALRAVRPPVDLTRADLAGMTLAGFRLRDAILADVRLSGGTLRRVDLTGATLTGADLSGAILDDVSLQGAQLDRADLAETTMTRCRLNGASLQRASLARAVLDDVHFPAAKLVGADLHDAMLRRVTLVGATLLGADLSGAQLYDVKLARASMEGVRTSELTRWPKDYRPPEPTGGQPATTG
jgi:uncharacterized protein YjbI with pentapeptide repeats